MCEAFDETKSIYHAPFTEIFGDSSRDLLIRHRTPENRLRQVLRSDCDRGEPAEDQLVFGGMLPISKYRHSSASAVMVNSPPIIRQAKAKANSSLSTFPYGLKGALRHNFACVAKRHFDGGCQYAGFPAFDNCSRCGTHNVG